LPGVNLLDQAESEKQHKQPSDRAALSAHLRTWLRDLLISVVASAFIITCIYQPVRVEGTSMQPELQNNDRLFINKVVYSVEKIHRGDVVVFHYPIDPSKSYIKRVIALPGDRLRIADGVVYVNGKAIPEPYVPADFRDDRSVNPEVIPPGDYWVMGDHRCVSSDSRDFGPVPRRFIYGKAEVIYWPGSMASLIH
jgi:signal peptidase I